jgi:hypothetical protein
MTEKFRIIEPAYIEECWSTIRLKDGAIIKVKHAIISVLQAFTEDGKPILLDDGTPKIGINHSQPIIGYFAPDAMSETKKGMN